MEGWKAGRSEDCQPFRFRALRAQGPELRCYALSKSLLPR
jgi:hypothetical protein